MARRDVFAVHLRDDPKDALTGVFATRSPDRPNPVGVHGVRLLEIAEAVRLRVEPLEALGGTPAPAATVRAGPDGAAGG